MTDQSCKAVPREPTLPEDKRRPLGVLWQHSETGRKTVEFANEPKGPTHWAGWHPIGMIYLDMTPPPAADK